jgi:hypothetical protein
VSGSVDTQLSGTNEPSFAATRERYEAWDKANTAKAPAGVAALQRAMTAAVASGDWAQVKELAEALETLWAAKRMVAQ